MITGDSPVSKNYVSVKVCDELYALLAAEAKRRHVNLIDVAVSAIAAQLGHPEFGYVPREPLGRPRTKHLNGNGHKSGKRREKVVA